MPVAFVWEQIVVANVAVSNGVRTGSDGDSEESVNDHRRGGSSTTNSGETTTMESSNGNAKVSASKKLASIPVARGQPRISAKDVVANVMNQQAGDAELNRHQPWRQHTGTVSRFTITFENKYDGSNIKTLSWVDVLGNHDYGGADFICNRGDSPAKCSSVDDLMDSSEEQILVAGNIHQFERWPPGLERSLFTSTPSRTQLLNFLRQNIAYSTATWEVMNSNYSPYAHCVAAGMDKWLNIINNTGVHLWLNGHTHGENHDSSSSLGVHFVDNELAEVSKKESASGIPTHAEEYVVNLDITCDGHEYGFFLLTASKDWLKLHSIILLMTGGRMRRTFNATTISGVAAKQ
ncbi:hypothetical protein JG687_00008073 [Phytophthora cactorum]|uniref:Calcineurin-like phosphoesterase domain-containing protein n=3 Tax=Phytophthora cactorum TaxID=29920 RepID=A0A8T1UGL4_9STRA|nr:hypothetical protein JG687_00008073 [Phytophthora cactorum]